MPTVDQLSAPEIFFDGVEDIKFDEGVVRLALYSNQGGARVVVVRLAIPSSGVPDVVQKLVVILTTAAEAILKPAGTSH